MTLEAVFTGVVGVVFAVAIVRLFVAWAALTRDAKDRAASQRVSRGEDPDGA